MAPKLLLIVKVRNGLVVRDTPRPESQGAKMIRVMPVGAALYAEDIHYIDGVQYARLVARDPVKPEWVRVAEPDGSIEYVDVIPLGEVEDQADLAGAIRELARAIRESKK